MNIQESNKNQTIPYKKITGRKEIPKYAMILKHYGEIGIILRTKKIVVFRDNMFEPKLRWYIILLTLQAENEKHFRSNG